MGNKLSGPFPSFEAAMALLNPLEITHLKESFKKYSTNQNSISLHNFKQIPVTCPQIIRANVFPRFFQVIDTKKDGVIDFEEFVSAVALFRTGQLDEKVKVLFLMYEPTKSNILTRDSIRKLLVDATISTQREDIPAATAEEWANNLSDLSAGMAETAINQFASQDGKMDFPEFLSFVRTEGCVQSLLHFLPSVIDS